MDDLMKDAFQAWCCFIVIWAQDREWRLGKTVKRNPATGHIPARLVWRESKLPEPAVPSGANDFLVKPSDMNNCCIKVEELPVSPH